MTAIAWELLLSSPGFNLVCFFSEYACQFQLSENHPKILLFYEWKKKDDAEKDLCKNFRINFQFLFTVLLKDFTYVSNLTWQMTSCWWIMGKRNFLLCAQHQTSDSGFCGVLLIKFEYLSDHCESYQLSKHIREHHSS